MRVRVAEPLALFPVIDILRSFSSHRHPDKYGIGGWSGLWVIGLGLRNPWLYFLDKLKSLRVGGQGEVKREGGVPADWCCVVWFGLSGLQASRGPVVGHPDAPLQSL